MKFIEEKSKSKGFSLIEVLVALIVISVGLLALASLQGELFFSSSDSKSRSEAATIAQDRIEELRALQKNTNIEGFDMKNWYSNLISGESVAGANNTYQITYCLTGTYKNPTNPAVPTTTSPIPGTDEISQIVANVYVSWATLPSGFDICNNYFENSAMVSTKLNFVDDSIAAALLDISTGKTVQSPTGRARLGDGRVKIEDPDSNPNFQDADDSDGDGLREYKKTTGEIVVVDMNDVDEYGEYKVLLTLSDACQSDTCTGFSQIRGKFFISTDSSTSDFVDSSGNPLIFLKASDAAYCKFFYGTSTDLIQDPAGNYVEAAYVGGVSNDDPLKAPLKTIADTDGNYYQYLNYSCYVGGGWYGNIGVLLDGGFGNSEHRRLCLGDPLAVDDNRPYDSPRVAIRRAYRGMALLVAEANSDPNDYVEANDVYDASIHTPITSDGIQYYVSVGIRDDSVITGQDMVFADLGVNSETDPDVLSLYCYDDASAPDPNPMIQDGSYDGQLFSLQPRDFVCLNDNDKFDTLPSALPDYYRYAQYCPYDLTYPPSNRHQLVSTLTFDAGSSGDSLDDMKAYLSIFTSDGEDNCYVDTEESDGSDVVYRCDFYTWDSGVYYGAWHGAFYAKTKATAPADFACETDTYAAPSGGLPADWTTDTPNKIDPGVTGLVTTCGYGASQVTVVGDITIDGGSFVSLTDFYPTFGGSANACIITRDAKTIAYLADDAAANDGDANALTTTISGGNGTKILNGDQYSCVFDITGDTFNEDLVFKYNEGLSGGNPKESLDICAGSLTNEDGTANANYAASFDRGDAVSGVKTVKITISDPVAQAESAVLRYDLKMGKINAYCGE